MFTILCYLTAFASHLRRRIREIMASDSQEQSSGTADGEVSLDS
jgi:hypothetical protein